MDYEKYKNLYRNIFIFLNNVKTLTICQEPKQMPLNVIFIIFKEKSFNTLANFFIILHLTMITIIQEQNP